MRTLYVPDPHICEGLSGYSENGWHWPDGSALEHWPDGTVRMTARKVVSGVAAFVAPVVLVTCSRPPLPVTHAAYSHRTEMAAANHDPVRYEPPATIPEGSGESPVSRGDGRGGARATSPLPPPSGHHNHEATSPALGERSAGGTLSPGGTWACIRAHESGGNYAEHGGGAYQFLDSTWQAMGGTGSAQNASPAEQDARAVALQGQLGWRPWTTARFCGVG